MEKQIIQIIRNKKIQDDIFLAIIPLIVFFLCLLLGYFIIKSEIINFYL
jgi:hypothetical protein